MLGFAACLFENLYVADEVADSEGWNAGLARAHHFAGAANLQILLGDAEAVRGLGHDAEPLLRDCGLFVRREKHAVGLIRAAPHAPAQLMKLREAETLRVLDNHHR